MVFRRSSASFSFWASDSLRASSSFSATTTLSFPPSSSLLAPIASDRDLLDFVKVDTRPSAAAERPSSSTSLPSRSAFAAVSASISSARSLSCVTKEPAFVCRSSISFFCFSSCAPAQAVMARARRKGRYRFILR